ncbi:MAG: transporter substrate-binding domain-containing protein [Actinobacteria bacterium]|nr:transporter substrate-binding domain-containing protein [Actinomycetota bacterium]
MAGGRDRVDRWIQEVAGWGARLWPRRPGPPEPPVRAVGVYETEGLSVRIEDFVAPAPVPAPVVQQTTSAPAGSQTQDDVRGAAPAGGLSGGQPRSGGSGPDADPGTDPGTDPDADTGADADPQTAPTDEGPPDARPGVAQDEAARVRRLRAAAVVVVLGLVVTVGVREAVLRRPPTVADLMRRAGWSSAQPLKVGVNGDIPGVSSCVRQATPAGETGPGDLQAQRELLCTGFDADIAGYVAEWLGMRIEYHTVVPEQRATLTSTERVPGEDGSRPVGLDLVAAGYSITAEREHSVVFAGPYLKTEAAVLTRVGVPYIPDLQTLADRIRSGELVGRVCTVGTATSEQYLEQARFDPWMLSIQLNNSSCVRRLLAPRTGTRDDVVAAFTDAALLAGFQALHPGELVMHNVTNQRPEAWGIAVGVVRRDAPYEPGSQEEPVDDRCDAPDARIDDKVRARRQLVLLALDDLRGTPGSLSRWNTSFGRMVNAEGAAAAPDGAPAQPIAEAVQPAPAGLCPVRRWPWESGGAIGAGTS